jgi:signal transduction histidine kinase
MLLKRQLRRHFGASSAPESIRPFVDQVNEAYKQADEERRMTERAFELSSQELLETNAELSLTLEALGKAVEQAQKASRAKDEFLAMLGHELRNPLAPIVTALEVARLKGASGVDARAIERPLRQVLRLVDDLLDISRVARGLVELDRRPLDISSAVHNAVEATRPMVSQHLHTLEEDVPPGLVVEGDEMRLTQVVSNLLINSVRYTEPGGLIQITGHQDGNEIVLRVRDNGRGIDAAALPQIFDSFGKPSPGGVSRGGGLGLGLTIVRSMVALHGGAVSAHSDGPGRGATFEVRLPSLALPIADPPAPPLEPLETVRRRRILVVDDNEEAADMLGDALTLSGNDVVVFHRASEALRPSEAFTPDIALLDVGLSDMSGHELGVRLRQRHPALKLIALTGFGQPSDRQVSERAGFAAHLVKPVPLLRLLEVINTL